MKFPASAAILFPLFLSVAQVRAGEVESWNRVATDAAAAQQTDPLNESRMLAIVHASIHDALNAIQPQYESYQPRKASPPDASSEAAIAGAAHASLWKLLPASKPAFDEALAGALERIEDRRAAFAGLQAGREAARAVLAARAEDGASRSVAYAPGKKAGQYRPTPPDFTPAFAAQWGAIRPFALAVASQYRPGPPPAVKSLRARQDIEEVRAYGGSESSQRSAEQSEIARYWYENSPQGWNRIAREVAAGRNLDEWASARLFALLNFALADGYIAGFAAKYHYRYWRPATAIREAGDASWLSFLDTPPLPDYPSNHTVEGAAAATVLARFYGTDFVSFSMTSGAPYPGLTRRFWSFSEAARENGASRVLAGIHFASAVEAGYLQGERIGAWTFEHALRPLKVDHASIK
jgi:membrane-associated phospholipid phosphatase